MYFRELLSDIIDSSDYDDFPYAEYETDLHGWGSQHALFEQLIEEHKPQRIIEIGTWLGASAIFMADVMKRNKIENPEILCIDTWVGSNPILWKKINRQKLMLKHGFPTQFYSFLANVKHSGHDDVITPFVMTSRFAGEYLQEKQCTVDMMYIDGSHEEVDVTSDLNTYFPLLKHKGCIMGDDWQNIGVRTAVTKFCEQHNLEVHLVDPNKWWFINTSQP